jgi:hypothetical protein
LILIFSVNTNHESVAYRSFSPSKFEARGARKVTTGIELFSPRLLRQPSRPSIIALDGTATHLDAGNSCQASGTTGRVTLDPMVTIRWIGTIRSRVGYLLIGSTGPTLAKVWALRA